MPIYTVDGKNIVKIELGDSEWKMIKGIVADIITEAKREDGYKETFEARLGQLRRDIEYNLERVVRDLEAMREGVGVKIR